jgi:hypothetical protein
MLRRFATAMALTTALIVPLAGCSANNGKTGDAKASPVTATVPTSKVIEAPDSAYKK